jgi:RNA polymerase sigma-70 factor (ECF subfamily)
VRLVEATTRPDIGGEDFARLTEQFRPELLAHCYRMLGSLHDAEDQVQETLLRAWRAQDTFEGRSSLRTWLHRIATNVCLRAMENRDRRPLPSGLGAPGDDPVGPVARPASEVTWLEPFPDALLRPESADPAAVAAARSGLRLALVAALQQLPPRQRTVLILRDVLGWRAAEVAALLGVSPVAVNSALQRAREQLRRTVPAADEIREPGGQADRAVLDRYAAAIENADVAELVELLHEDATFEMPPLPTWFRGRDNITRFLAARVLTGPGIFTLVPVAANGQPAFAVYRRAEDGVPRAYGLQVLTVGEAWVTAVVAFLTPDLFPAFGLPAELPAAVPAELPAAGRPTGAGQ